MNDMDRDGHGTSRQHGSTGNVVGSNSRAIGKAARAGTTISRENAGTSGGVELNRKLPAGFVLNCRPCIGTGLIRRWSNLKTGGYEIGGYRLSPGFVDEVCWRCGGRGYVS